MTGMRSEAGLSPTERVVRQRTEEEDGGLSRRLSSARVQPAGVGGRRASGAPARRRGPAPLLRVQTCILLLCSLLTRTVLCTPQGTLRPARGQQNESPAHSAAGLSTQDEHVAQRRPVDGLPFPFIAPHSYIAGHHLLLSISDSDLESYITL